MARSTFLHAPGRQPAPIATTTRTSVDPAQSHKIRAGSKTNSYN